jgi:hypothetical protein
MHASWYNRDCRKFDNGISWVRFPRKRRPSLGGEGFGLWFCRCFPWVWPLTPWTAVPDIVHDRAERKAGWR